MAAGALLRLAGSLERIELFTCDIEGRRYLFHALYAMLRREGLGAEAEALRRAIAERLAEQAARLRVANENYLYGFTRDLLGFVLQGLETESLRPPEAAPYLDLAEETALRLRADMEPPLPCVVVSEYAGYAAATRDSHYLDRAYGYLQKCPPSPPRPRASREPETVEDVCDRGSFRERAAFALAQGYARLGRETGVPYAPSIRGLVETLDEPFHAMRGRYLLLRAASEHADGAQLGHAVARADVESLLAPLDGAARVLALAEAARWSARLRTQAADADAEHFLDLAMEGADRAFLAAHRGKCAELFMSVLGGMALRSGHPGHLRRMEEFLERARPRTETFRALVHGAFLRFVETLAALYAETGDEAHLETARRYVGHPVPSGTPEEALPALAEALLRRGRGADAARLLARVDDDRRTLRSFALEALAHHAQNDKASFAQTLERILNHAEVSPLGDSAEALEECVDMLRDAAVEAGRTRFFRSFIALARRRCGSSEGRYRVETKCALGLVAAGTRHASPDGASPAAEGEAIIEGLPGAKKMQGLLALAEWERASAEAAPPSAVEGEAS